MKSSQQRYSGETLSPAVVRQWLPPALLLALLPLFFTGGPDWASSPLEKAVWNLGHIAFFWLLITWLSPHLPHRAWQAWGLVTVAVLITGALVEMAQDGLQREGDWHDMLRNLAGAWFALAWQSRAAPHSFGHRRGLTWLTRGMTLALVVFELALVARVATQHMLIRQQLPALYDFSCRQPRDYWSGHVSRASHPARPGNHILRIDLGTEPYSGASLDNLAADWRGYERLELSLLNPSTTPLTMTLRINDRRHDRGDNAFDDRFNQRLHLEPGYNRFTIDLDQVRHAPAGREMEMNDIRRLGLFAVRLPAPRVVYLLDMSLDLP